MKKISLIFILIYSTFLLSCSSDDDNSADLSGFGSATVNLSGDLEGTRTGMADFHYHELGSMYMWEISFHDLSPQTFALTLMLQSHEPISRPTPGTYEIGFDPLDPDVFSASFINIEDSNFVDSVEYDTFDNGGTLTIETSTDEKVTGHFEFTANSRDDNFNSTGTIHVSGSFEALKRIPL